MEIDPVISPGMAVPKLVIGADQRCFARRGEMRIENLDKQGFIIQILLIEQTCGA